MVSILSPSNNVIVDSKSPTVAWDGKYVVYGNLEFEGHSDLIRCVATTRDGNLIASGGADNTVRIWNAHSGVCSLVLSHDDWVQCVAFSADGSKIISGSHDGTARVFSVESGAQLACLDHGKTVWSCAFSPNGEVAVTGSTDKSVRVWNTVSGELLHVLMGHNAAVWSCSFNVTGTRIVSGSVDKTLYVWDTVTGSVIHMMQGVPSIALTEPISDRWLDLVMLVDCYVSLLYSPELVEAAIEFLYASSGVDGAHCASGFMINDTHCVVGKEGYVQVFNLKTRHLERSMAVSDEEMEEIFSNHKFTYRRSRLEVFSDKVPGEKTVCGVLLVPTPKPVLAEI